MDIQVTYSTSEYANASWKDREFDTLRSRGNMRGHGIINIKIDPIIPNATSKFVEIML